MIENSPNRQRDTKRAKNTDQIQLTQIYPEEILECTSIK